MTDIEPVEILNTNLDAQIELCTKLEELADCLPNNVDAQYCLGLSRVIAPTLSQAQDFEENVLFPKLQNKYKNDEQMLATLERLHYEHWEDENYAEELRECMVNFINERSAGNIAALSYMLRGFFQSIRRHIAFEREFLVPIVAAANFKTSQQ